MQRWRHKSKSRNADFISIARRAIHHPLNPLNHLNPLNPFSKPTALSSVACGDTSFLRKGAKNCGDSRHHNLRSHRLRQT